jgi:galactoside O-acetyltransferase
MLYDDEFIALAIKGKYSDSKKQQLNVLQQLLLYLIKIGMAVAFAVIYVICFIPLISSLYETFARSYSRGALGFFLRGVYYKTKLKHMGKNVFIDVGVTIWTPGNVEIGDGSHIDTYVTILGGEKGHGGVSIGRYVHIASYCMIAGRGGIKIGDFAAIAAGSKIYSGSNYYENPDDQNGKLLSMSASAPVEMQFVIEKPVLIEDYAFIGLNCVVLPGVSIGKAAVIGAGSMVSHDVIPFGIAVGTPAKVIRQRLSPK